MTDIDKMQGGVMEEDEDRIKTELGGVIQSVSKTLPDPSRVSADMWKFAKLHDRRNYQLIRFAMAANSDYRTVTKAIRELVRRIQSANSATLLETLTPILYRSSSLIYNRSHIPAVMSISRTNENGLANAAHELLKVISSRNPEVLEAQVSEMCKDLEVQAPKAAADSSATSSNENNGAEDILKACSGFARRLPSKLPKERKFLQALVNYALYSTSPRSAKHAVTILMVAADKKEMYAKDLVQKCISGWKYGFDFFLTRLAALSQLNLLAPRETDDESDEIISIAINQVLVTNRTPQPDSGYSWSDDVSDETAAKEWALKVIVNRLRAKEGSDGEEDFRAHSNPVFSILMKLITDDGELSKEKDTPATQKPRLRILATRQLLKLCASHSLCDKLVTPADFNMIALVAQDPIYAVRSSFISYLNHKLSLPKTYLAARWYTIGFLLAFEPNEKLKSDNYTWLCSRANFFSQMVQASGRKAIEQQTVMESVFSRLLSLLAYHPDYPSAELDEETRNRDIADFARYILFYLSAIANEHNLSLIFHIAQRVKQTRDGITKSDEISTHLYTLSDLAQATIRRFADAYSQQHKFGGASGTNILQTYPGKVGLPSSIFTTMRSHREAQEVAEKNLLPDEVDDMLDGIVRASMKAAKAATTATATSEGSQNGATIQTRKRKSSSSTKENVNGITSANTGKKAKTTTLATRSRKTTGTNNTTSKPKSKRKSNQDDSSSDENTTTTGRARSAASTVARPSRRSNRGTTKKEVSYVDRDSDDDDMEMEEWNQGVDEAAENENKDEEMKKDEEEEGQDDDDDDGASEMGDGDEDDKNGEQNRKKQQQQQQEEEEVAAEKKKLSQQQSTSSKVKANNRRKNNSNDNKKETAASTRRSSRKK